MNTLIPTLDHISWNKQRQVFKPEARCFCLPVSEHPGLYELTCEFSDYL